MFNPFNPFDPQPCTLLNWRERGPLREAVVAVPVEPLNAVATRVIVPAGDGPHDWLEQACITAIVTVVAVRARLVAEAADQTTD